jgi:type IV secretory pathway TraG/TraD family ATPase VirD4
MPGIPALDSVLGTGAVFAIAAATLAALALVRARRRIAPEIHKRGVVLKDSVGWRRHIDRGAASSSLTLAGVPIAERDETKHFKLIGTTGTGKSTAIRELLGGALSRGDRVVVADPDGGYCGQFFNRYRGDVVLNPFEPSSVKWDPLAEIQSSYDAAELATGLIPSSSDPGANEWRAYARTFLAAVLKRCRELNQRDSSELWRLLAVASGEELQPLVAGTPAQPFLELENARMFGSIRSVAVSAIAAFEHVQAQRAAPFAVRHWIRCGPSSGALFIPYKANQIAALKSMISTWVRLAIFEALSGGENKDQRLWFVMDELDALGAIDGLKDALARLRKFGGRCVLGFQSLAQVSSTYGGDAQTLIENCGNTLILRCSGSENGGTAQFASRLIGEREVLRQQVSHGSDRESAFSLRGSRRSESTSRQHVTEAAVMPSQVEQLPDFRGYLKTASSRAWLRVSFAPKQSWKG